jgi:carbon-monoxide dehydrogenase large subunit
MTSSLIGNLIGESVRRSEDQRFLSGAGRYSDDVTLPGMLHAAFVRSPMAHAGVTGCDVSEARALPGVVAVYTADDLAQVTNPMQVQIPLPGLRTPTFGPLANGKVRFVGDPVAIVVAESRYLAEDACDLVVVDYDPINPVVDASAALSEDSTLVFDELGSNEVFRQEFATDGLEAAFVSADRVIRRRFQQHRCANVPLEGRGGVAWFDPSSGELTYYASTQAPHALRMMLSGLLNQPTHRLHVVAPDIGGSFGLKWSGQREDVAVCGASRLLGRPVKWIEDRNENLVAGGHARDEAVEIEMALRSDGKILGLRADMTMNQGAYPIMGMPSPLLAAPVRVMLPGPYRIEQYGFGITVVATNKASYVAYRGPWAVETWVRERMLDICARELGLDPLELRRLNMVRSEELPRAMVSGPTLDPSMSAHQTLERAADLSDYAAFRDRQRRERSNGRLLGLGLATFIEPAPGPPDFAAAMGYPVGTERAKVRLEPDGSVTVFTSQVPHGQGHQTTLAQVVANRLSVPFEQVRVAWGDTQLTPFSMMGTGGSKAATMASGAVMRAAESVKAQIFEVASAMLEANIEDLELANGAVQVRGVPAAAVPLAQIAMMVYLMPGALPIAPAPTLEGLGDFDGGLGGWSQATHACWVEVDLEFGAVRILRYLVVEDCGRLINPAIVDGQIRGGVAQGIGQVLYERAHYDDQGQFVTGTFMDYLLPTAVEIPPIEIDHLESPAYGEVHFRGVGEGGAIGAPAAVTNAIEDALCHLGVEVLEQYLPPSRILELAHVLDGE